MEAKEPSSRSLGRQVIPGKRGAKWAACRPVPEPISSTRPSPGSTRFSTSRIGPLLRSHASEKWRRSVLFVMALKVGTGKSPDKETHIVRRRGVWYAKP